ncbi:ExsB family protein [Anaeromyxobacter sp. Fw109-5]|nr:ExsB family protein [Anaeromyxobacter sp. Fw109-5]
MSVVPLVSGGLDSAVMSILIREEGLEQHPLFIDYGQRSRSAELTACRRVFRAHQLPRPAVAKLPGYGRLIPSGLTDKSMRLFDDAFLPGRNLLFLLTAAAYAYKRSARAVAIGLLDERYALFPDQTRSFVQEAEHLISNCMGVPFVVLAPMMHFSKVDVLRLAQEYNVVGAHSCHAGTATPCGACVACRQYPREG